MRTLLTAETGYAAASFPKSPSDDLIPPRGSIVVLTSEDRSPRCSVILRLIRLGLAVTMFTFAWRAFGQNFPGAEEAALLKSQEDFVRQLKPGDTNAPLLLLDSFEGPIRTFSVRKSGKTSASSSNGISRSTEWDRPPITSTNLQILMAAINGLPASEEHTIPLRRQLHILALRTNEWCHLVYDSDNFPKEVRGVLLIIGPPFSKLGAKAVQK